MNILRTHVEHVRLYTDRSMKIGLKQGYPKCYFKKEMIGIVFVTIQ